MRCKFCNHAERDLMRTDINYITCARPFELSFERPLVSGLPTPHPVDDGGAIVGNGAWAQLCQSCFA